MVLKTILNSIIQLSHDELALLKKDDIDITLINRLEADRFDKIKILFESFNKAELAKQTDLLNQIKMLDQELTTSVLERKKIITKRLSEFRSKNKASKAYKSI